MTAGSDFPKCAGLAEGAGMCHEASLSRGYPLVSK